MGQIIINEQEKEDILKQYSSEPESKGKIMTDSVITKLKIQIWSQQGLTPYEFIKKYPNYGLKEITEGTKTPPIPFYLLTQSEFDKISQLANSTKKIIDLKHEQINPLMDYVPSSIQHILK